jgi:hypothetical protein
VAAAAIPLITTLAPSIISLIASLVHQKAPVAEQQYGPGTGAVKFGAVFGDVVMALQKAAAAGQIDKVLPADDTIKAIIQAVVTAMQLSGVLATSPAAQAVTPTPGQSIVLSAGQSVTITVK